MRVRITKALAGSIDGIQLSRLSKDHVYDVNTSLACYLLSEQVAEPAGSDEPTAVLPVENRMFERPTGMRAERPILPRSLAADRAVKIKKRDKKKIIILAVVVSLLGAALPLLAQPPKDTDKEIRITGCVQWEKDYRQQRNEGRGGAFGTGAGVGNEFVLTMIKPDGGRKATAYSITGDREKELGRRIGQQIEVIGTIEDEGKPDSERFGDLPRIKMTAWVPVKDFCPAR